MENMIAINVWLFALMAWWCSFTGCLVISAFFIRIFSKKTQEDYKKLWLEQTTRADKYALECSHHCLKIAELQVENAKLRLQNI